MGVKDSFLGRLLGNADKYTDEQVAQTVTLLVENGVKHGATDIHIEPNERFASVRYRIDGVLHNKHKLPISALPAVIAEIKELANMHVADNHLPQEGQYAALVGEDQFEVQVHTLPVIGGEKAVLHLLRRISKPLHLDTLGFWGDGLTALQAALARSHGLVLVGAPRRSGNTTTMHSMLQLVTTPSLGVATVEAAIEYRLPGASQTIVRPHHGITFHQGVQAALNQDPNILMVSSLPDQKTAELAIQASVGGHMVLAGVYANNASVAIAHVRSLSQEHFLLATCLRAVVSQRLVRALCKHCRERFIPSEEQISEIEKLFNITAVAARRKLHELESKAAAAGIDHNKYANSTPSHITALWRASDEGCDACEHTGYQGSIAITEIMINNDDIQKSILDQEPASKIHDAGLKHGFVPMELDGLVKALRGQTTVQEVLRTFTA